MPSVDRVILALTANPTYTGFYNYVADIWAQKYHVTPTLAFYGTPGECASFLLQHEPKHKLLLLERVPEVSPNPECDWACTWGLFYAASLYPTEVCLLAGIDQVPLNGVILDHIKAAPRDRFTVGFGNAYGDPRRPLASYPSSHLVGTGNKFKEVFGIDNDWQTEVRKVFACRERYPLHRDFWGLDEAYASDLIRQRHRTVGDIHFIETFHDQFQPTRLWRGKDRLQVFDFAGVRAGRYSEWHADRPFESNNPALLLALRDAIPEYRWT